MRSILMFIVLAVSVSFAQPYLLVVDASGSMDDMVLDENGGYATKMDAARDAAKGFVDSSDSEIGLIVFDDCDSSGDVHSGSIRLLQDFTYDKEALGHSIDSLEPYGSTPVADARSEAKNHMLSTRGAGTIVLITDGEETCEGDPVAVAGEIYSSGIKVQVVGYMLASAAEDQARAIAQAGGGSYYDVQDAQALESTLVQIGSEDPSLSCCAGFVLLILPFLSLFFRKA